MASSSTLEGDYIYRGNVKFGGTVVLPSSTFGNTQINPADPLAVNKTIHQYVKNYSQAKGAASVAEQRVIHVAEGAGTILDGKVGLTVVNSGAATITVSIKKNGTTITSSSIVLDNTTAAYTGLSTLLFTSSSYAAGDVFEVVVAVAAGGGTIGQGIFVSLTFGEAYQ